MPLNVVKIHRKVAQEGAVCVFFAALCVVLTLLPTGFEKQIYLNAEGVRATVLEIDNSGVYNTGLIRQGDQRCRIRIESGAHKGEIVSAFNLYTGKIEFDKTFKAGDSAWVLIEQNADGNITFANMIDHYRLRGELALIALFAVLLMLCFGVTGLRTMLSFAFSLLAIWKLLIPLMLKGFSPIVAALLIGNAVSAAALLLVAGVTKKTAAAMVSSAACSFLTCGAAALFGGGLNIHGAVMQWSESLLYAGFERLDLTAVFQAGVYLACSGAILDLAVDISSALEELILNQPAMTRRGLFASGMRIGRSVVGSQASTLLLAYMGSYLSVMMVYMAQGTPMLNIFNSKMVAAEIMHTFVGCIGLVLVCPLTSFVGAYLYKNPIHSEGKNNPSW